MCELTARKEAFDVAIGCARSEQIRPCVGSAIRAPVGDMPSEVKGFQHSDTRDGYTATIEGIVIGGPPVERHPMVALRHRKVQSIKRTHILD